MCAARRFRGALRCTRNYAQNRTCVWERASKACRSRIAFPAIVFELHTGTVENGSHSPHVVLFAVQSLRPNGICLRKCTQKRCRICIRALRVCGSTGCCYDKSHMAIHRHDMHDMHDKHMHTYTHTHAHTHNQADIGNGNCN